MRPTLHRARFHTDRVVAARRTRLAREQPDWDAEPVAGAADRVSYGRLAHRDPWDCGGHCLVCHGSKYLEPRRAREERAWRRDWGLT